MQPSSHVASSAGLLRRWTSPRVWDLSPVRCFFILLILLCLAPVLRADAAQNVVPFHLMRGFAVMVPVTVNGHGPYDFMLDTGSTVTAVDRELGQELALEPEGQGTVTTLTQHISASIALVQRLECGPLAERNIPVMVRDLSGLRSIDPAARGVLGQNALNHADFLLDYQHKRIQFDLDGELVRSLAGHRVPLRRDANPGNPQYTNLAVDARLAGNVVGTLEFLLDSGAASPVVFDTLGSTSGYNEGFVVDTEGRQLLAGIRELHLVIDGQTRDLPAHVLAFRDAGREAGGLLPTRIFNRIYISNSGVFAIFEPKMKKSGSLDRMIAGLPPESPGHGPE
jgi:hypothetical protein